MAPAPEWDSDSGSSDEEEDSGVYLGLSDGPLEGDDESNPLVSRIGGKPAWLPFRNAGSSALLPPAPEQVSQCKICGQEMELAVQIFAPLEDSAFDRTLTVWACARAQCQRYRDSRPVRVFRSTTFNARWASRLQKKQERQRAKAARLEEEKKRADKERQALLTSNPFASNSLKSDNPFASGASSGNPFDASAGNPFAPAPTAGPVREEAELAESDSTVSGSEDEVDADAVRLEEEMAIKASLKSGFSEARARWDTAPAYEGAEYISTIPEPYKPTTSLPEGVKVEESPVQEAPSAARGNSQAAEKYERQVLKTVDTVFQTFVERVSRLPKQLIRYEFNGEPLPFSNKGSIYARFWKKPLAPHAHDAYDPRAAGTCPKCGGKRVFELQLMPNVVNMLRPGKIKDLSALASGDKDKSESDAAQAKRREIEAALGRSIAVPDGSGLARASALTGNERLAKTGITWGSVLIFVCENDCTPPSTGGDGTRETCTEELAEVMWEE